VTPIPIHSHGSSFDDTIALRKKNTTHKTTYASASPIILKSVVVRSLFIATTAPNTMEKPWPIATFKPLNINKFPNAPNLLHKKYDELLPKFNGMNAITIEKHIHEFYWVVNVDLIMKQDIVMMLFSLTL